MAEPVTTDVFKFLAVRPPQLVTEQETRRTIIRDARAADPVGERKLASLARSLASPDAALARWREFDLSPLGPLVDGYRAVVRRYETLGAADAPPDGRDVLKEAGAVDALDDTRVLELAWGALYVADSTGAEAGARLEGPLAALRVLHFAELLGEQTAPARDAALEALRATPAIAPAFYEARVTGKAPAVGGTPPPAATQPELSQRSTQLRALAQEIAATERTLERVTSAPALTAPVMQATPVVQEDGWSRSEFKFESGPTIHDALTGQLSREEASLLDRLQVDQAAPVPVATQTLQTHLNKLKGQAFALGRDEQFQGFMRDASTPIQLAPARIREDAIADGRMLQEQLLDKTDGVNVAGRITPLGVGDLKVVKQTLLSYQAGEVAHIENVLKGESKERKHRKLDRTETTLFTSEEETKDTERDTQSTDRFELKREAEQTIKEDMSLKAGLNVTASYGPIVATATGDFAYSTSKQDSQKSSSNFAHEVVDRSVSKVQTKTKTERTTKTLNEVEEINTHGVSNTDAKGEHVIGVYRWVDKRYRAQIYNYGVRFLLEFIVPEPAAFFRAARRHRAPRQDNLREPAAFENLKGEPLAVKDMNEGEYHIYASRYGAAGVTPPPPEYRYASAVFTKDALEIGKTAAIEKPLVIEAGYKALALSATASAIYKNNPQFSVQMGGYWWRILQTPEKEHSPGMEIQRWMDPEAVAPITGSYPLSVVSYDLNAFVVNVQVLCQRTTTLVNQWQLQTFDKIYAAYQALKTAYDQKIAQADAASGIAIEGRNPTTNRLIEQTELKKLCITMMTGEQFNRYGAITEDPKLHYAEVDVLEALDEGPIIQFFEQAFEWEHMTYQYYPYFWGRKKHWIENTHQSDPDPLFEQFLSAGAARIVVPVPLAYQTAVEFLLQSSNPDLRKRVWGGGDRPTLDSPLYRSITDELRDQTDDLAGAKPDKDVEPWEFTLPTTLVWLQKDSTLPSFT